MDKYPVVSRVNLSSETDASVHLANGDLGSIGKSFSFLGLEYRPYLDFGLREAGDVGLARDIIPGKIAIGCALPKVHVEDKSDEAKVASELLDIMESL